MSTPREHGSGSGEQVPDGLRELLDSLARSAEVGPGEPRDGATPRAVAVRKVAARRTAARATAYGVAAAVLLGVGAGTILSRIDDPADGMALSDSAGGQAAGALTDAPVPGPDSSVSVVHGPMVDARTTSAAPLASMVTPNVSLVPTSESPSPAATATATRPDRTTPVPAPTGGTATAAPPVPGLTVTLRLASALGASAVRVEADLRGGLPQYVDPATDALVPPAGGIEPLYTKVTWGDGAIGGSDGGDVACRLGTPVLPLARTYALTHTYAEPGSYTVTVETAGCAPVGAVSRTLTVVVAD